MALSAGGVIALLIILSLVAVTAYFAYLRWRRTQQRKQLLAWAGRSMAYDPPAGAAVDVAPHGPPAPAPEQAAASTDVANREEPDARLIPAGAAATPRARSAAFVGEVAVFTSPSRGFRVSHPPSWPAVVGQETDAVAVSFTAPEDESEYCVLRVVGEVAACVPPRQQQTLVRSLRS